MRHEPYPLDWPNSWPRAKVRKRSQFKSLRLGENISLLRDEMKRFAVDAFVISTNLRLRIDGLPYATGRTPEDPGVAVYFEKGGRHYVIACDTYQTVQENARAIMQTIKAVRMMERYGVSGVTERAMSGFSAIEAPPAKPPWREVLGIDKAFPACPDTYRLAQIKGKERMRKAHPDMGGSDYEFRQIQDALDRAREECIGDEPDTTRRLPGS